MSSRGRFDSSALIVIATLAASACSSRSCSRVVLSKEQEVGDLAKQRGVELTVRSCRDASRGGSMIDGVFSCLATIDAAKKQKLIDAFGLTQAPRPWTGKIHYTATDTFTCNTRIDLSPTEHDQWGKPDIWYVENKPASTPGMESVELHFYPNGEACIQLERKP